jgi:hypothetical protein
MEVLALARFALDLLFCAFRFDLCADLLSVAFSFTDVEQLSATVLVKDRC